MRPIYVCPALGRPHCTWEGSAHDLGAHFQVAHPHLCHREWALSVVVETGRQNRLVFVDDDEVYMVQSEIGEREMALRLRYLGAEDEVQGVRYDVRVEIRHVWYNPKDNTGVITRMPDGWRIDFDLLYAAHGAGMFQLHCQFSIERPPRPSILRINNKFVEENCCDETERLYMNGIENVEQRLAHLRNSTGQKETIKKCSTCGLDGCNGCTQNVRNGTSLEHSHSFSEGTTRQLNHNFGKNKRNSAETSSLTVSKRKSFAKIISFGDKFKLAHSNSLKEELDQKRQTKNSTKSSLSSIDFVEDLELGEVLCSACNLTMLPPIYFCQSGHSVCTVCTNKNVCKLCGGQMTKRRNNELENMSRTIRHKCRYYSNGCNERLLYNDLRGHEAECMFCQYRCLETCDFSGRYQNFVNHLKIMHASLRIVQSLLAVEFPKNVEFIVADRAKGFFHCRSIQKGDVITWQVIFCGPKERTFFCELIFKGARTREAIPLKKNKDNVYELSKTLNELKAIKAKDKHAIMNITSYNA